MLSIDTALPPGADPMTCNLVSCIPARWVCKLTGAKSQIYVGSVISWPSWSAYENNARTGDRIVYSRLDGRVLYPYMGAWANGGQITVVNGVVLVIEWKRGSDEWRERRLNHGDTYTISLLPHEDGAMIESPDGVEPKFTVSLANFHPQHIRPAPEPLPPFIPPR